MQENHEVVIQENAPVEEDVKSMADKAANLKLSDSERSQAITNALDFFLDVDNNVEDKPRTTEFVVMRWDVDTQEEVPLVNIPVRTIDDEELKSLRLRSRLKGPNGVRTEETDEIVFYTLVCASAVNFSSEQKEAMLSKFKTIEEAIRKTLLVGERIALGQNILAFSGFGAGVTSKAKMEIEAAKK